MNASTSKRLPATTLLLSCASLIAQFESLAISFEFSSIPNSSLEITSQGTTASIGFNPIASENFQIDNVKDGVGTAVGYKGNFSGNWIMGPVTTITLVPLVESAPITGTGTLTIYGNGGNNLTANLAWVQASSLTTVSSLKSIAEFNGNLSSVSYAGSDPDLLAFASSGIGTADLSYLFKSLSQSVYGGGSGTTTFSGNLAAAVPESSEIGVCAGIGLLAFGVFRARKAR